MTAGGHDFFLCGDDENILKLYFSDGCTTLNIERLLNHIL